MRPTASRGSREQTRGIGPDIVVQCATSAANPEGLTMVRRGGRFVAIGVEGRDMTLPRRLDHGEVAPV